MSKKEVSRRKIIQDAERLAAEDGIELDQLSGTEFAGYLDDWILGGRLSLQRMHPLKRGSFVFPSNLSPRGILALADDEFEKSKLVKNSKSSGSIFLDGIEYVRKDEDDGPRDTPVPEIYGEILPPVSCRKIVVVPGIMGSEILERTLRPNLGDDWKKIWPPLSADSSSLAPVDHLIETSSDAGLPGAPIREARILEAAYDGLLGRLRADGYREDNNKLFPWGYDWTKSNRENGEKLKDFINTLAGVTPSNPEGNCVVDVICHSMGGLVTRAAIKSGAMVRRTVYLASPHHGAPKAYFALHPKAPSPLASLWWEKLLINKLWNAYAAEVQPREGDLGALLASLARQMPSVFELLPDEYYFQTNSYFVTLWYWTSATNIIGRDATYYDTADINFPAKDGMRRKVMDAMRFKSWLGRIPPGEHLSIYSNTEKTNDSIVFSYRGTNGFRDPEDSGQGGDGTVPTSSANVGAKILFNRGSHVAIPNRQDTYDKIRIYLKLGNGQ